MYLFRTDCGMELFTDEVISGLLSNDLATAKITVNNGAIGFEPAGKAGTGSTDGKYIKWHTFTDNAKSVVEDVKRIRAHTLVPSNIPIYGYIYDVKTGKLVEVPEATAAGR